MSFSSSASRSAQATVAKYMVRRRGIPSQNWRSFLRNQNLGIAAIDMFVVASASFRLLYVMIILAHDRRRIVRTAVTEYPTAGWLSRRRSKRSIGHGATVSVARPRRRKSRVEAMNISGSRRGTAIALAEP